MVFQTSVGRREPQFRRRKVARVVSGAGGLASDSIEPPSIKTIVMVQWGASCVSWSIDSLQVFRPQLVSESELVILINVCWFQEAANLGSTLSLRITGRFCRFFPVFGVQFGIVARELLQLNQKVSKMGFESRQILIEGEETVDKLLDLGPGKD